MRLLASLASPCAFPSRLTCTSLKNTLFKYFIDCLRLTERHIVPYLSMLFQGTVFAIYNIVSIDFWTNKTIRRKMGHLGSDKESNSRSVHIKCLCKYVAPNDQGTQPLKMTFCLTIALSPCYRTYRREEAHVSKS